MSHLWPFSRTIGKERKSFLPIKKQLARFCFLLAVSLTTASKLEASLVLFLFPQGRCFNWTSFILFFSAFYAAINVKLGPLFRASQFVVQIFNFWTYLNVIKGFSEKALTSEPWLKARASYPEPKLVPSDIWWTGVFFWKSFFCLTFVEIVIHRRFRSIRS